MTLRPVLAATASWFFGVAGILRRRVHRLDCTFHVAPDGRTVPVAAASGPLSRAIGRLDRFLRWRRGIFEFTTDPTCVFRLAIARDECGEPVGYLHLWNEQLPRRADLSWGLQLCARLKRSLSLLAGFVNRGAPLGDVRVFTAETSLDADYTLARLDAVGRRFGFHVAPCDDDTPAWKRLAHDLHARLLRRAYPGPVVQRADLRRIRFWITREELLELHLGMQRDDSKT